MKRDITSLAVFGGEPVFAYPLPVGQMNFGELERFEKAMRGIFSRRYYTNHGPLAQLLENRLCDFIGVQHAVCMTNATIGLMVAAKALELRSKVIVPAFSFAGTVQSLTWAGLQPIFCDVDPRTYGMTAELVAPLIGDDVSAILGVHPWGNACDIGELERLARLWNLRIYFDATDSFGCTYKGKRIGRFGDMEIFSFHASKILNSAEGGCACTNDDFLAKRLRNIRSSYGSGPTVPVTLTANGRMSEAQAALALLSLEDYLENRLQNQERFELYTELLGKLPGIKIISPISEEQSNYQNVVLDVDINAFGLGRNEIAHVLRAENVLGQENFAFRMPWNPPYDTGFVQNIERLTTTDAICSRVMELPSGQKISKDNINVICHIMVYLHEHAAAIREKLAASLER